MQPCSFLPFHLWHRWTIVDVAKVVVPQHDRFSDEQGSQSEAVIMTLTCTVKYLTCSRIHCTAGIHHDHLWRKVFIILYYFSMQLRNSSYVNPIYRNFPKGGITNHILFGLIEGGAQLCCSSHCRHTALTAAAWSPLLVWSFSCSPQFSLDTPASTHSIKTCRLG